MYRYYQIEGGEEAWKPVQADYIDRLVADKHPMFVTVLATDRLASKDMPRDEKLGLKYLGPLYVDFDSQDIARSIADMQSFIKALRTRFHLSMDCYRVYATGSKGFHIEIPMENFLPKVPKAGLLHLPLIYKRVILDLAEDTIDWKVYSIGMGRMWRQPNVKRPNGKHKVVLTEEQVDNLTPDLVDEITSSPVELEKQATPEMNLELAVLFDKHSQDVGDKLRNAKKRKPLDPGAFKTPMPSIELLMMGEGVKPGAGFNQLAMQLAIYARTVGMPEDTLIEKCKGLCEKHQSDGRRYNTPQKREDELRRMYAVIGDDPCYEYAAPPLRSLLSHPAPDLDGIAIDRAEIEKDIAEAKDKPVWNEGDTPASTGDLALDEFADVASGVEMTKYGIYAETEFGKRRISATALTNARALRSMDSNKIEMLEADVLVNGKFVSRQPIELSTFHSASEMNKFASRVGAAFNGTESQVKAVFLRTMEDSKKTHGGAVFVHEREGLALVNIPHHHIEDLRTPFLIWADGKDVVLEKRAREAGLNIVFQGMPDPRGIYRCDLMDAPSLSKWLEEPGSRDTMRDMLENLFRCQRPDMLGPMLGWLTACFYKSIFQRAYKQFPLMHVNGQAGSGKCLGRDTLVLRSDGTSVPVQDVQTGEFLLGPDGQPRKVLSVCSGREMLYRVTPVKGQAYVVNASHILSLRKSEAAAFTLSDGSRIEKGADVVNVNVVTYMNSMTSTRKALKGWRSGEVSFHRPEEVLLLDPYWLGCWLGDGAQEGPTLYKPACAMTAWWEAHAKAHGCSVSVHQSQNTDCPGWAVVRPTGVGSSALNSNPFTRHLRAYGLIKNKHIPDAFKYGSVRTRLRLLAGLLDSDGSLTGSSCYDWISKDQKLAEDFAFVSRSLGFACYVTATTKRIKATGFEGTYWRCSLSGDVDRIPCLDKKASPRKQVKRHLVTGIKVQPIGEGDYFGFELDGDRLFLLGDFTVTHNTQMSMAMARLFYYNQEPKTVTPGSTVFALSQCASGTDSIPMILDEYKPHEMPPGMHDKLRLMFRDAYNARDVQRGGGSRDNDNFRALSTTSLSAPIMFIAEAIEEETALMERVVLVTMTPPPSGVAHRWASRFYAFRKNAHILAMIGRYIASKLVLQGYTPKDLQEEFDPMYNEARDELMLTEKDLESGLDLSTLQDKQAARERSVFNFTVAKFGLLKFKEVVQGALGEGAFKDDFEDFEAHAYVRMKDLAQSTVPEYMKVLNVLVDLSYEDPLLPHAMRVGHEFGFGNVGGRDTLELAARASYARYRQYCRLTNIKPLYAGEQAFAHSLRGITALMHVGESSLSVPGGAHVFDMNELLRAGLRGFKPPKGRRSH